MAALSDPELVRSFQDGDEQAFNELVRRHQDKVYILARRFAPDHDEADEIVQESFIKVYQGLATFRGESGVFTWIYRITVNVALNAIRRKRTRQMFSLEDAAGQTADSAESPDAVLEAKEQRLLIAEAIESLPEKQKAVFILRYYDETPYEELSVILGTSVGGLKANYFHAVRKIAEHVKRANSTR